ncbi:MAG TPA: alpha/beta fold hydrolase [Bacteroidales bacterium]
MKNLNPVTNESIAIVGLSCRFPGAKTPEEFWNVLLNGKDVITDIPSSRIPIDHFYDDDKDAEGKTNQKQGAYLENIHHFDPFFFNISPKEAIEMHPSQKLMLELAWESIERSNIPYQKILGSNAGVYFGHIWSDFEHFRKERGALINSFSAIGQSANIIASRISYFLGLTGPSFVLDTGCSSSLVAMALGIQSLRNKTIDLCFTGGINHILNPEQYVYLGKFGGLSSKGRCSAFDADADGFVRAEGAGVVIMKRLSDALRDNDRIYAIVRGCAMNNNGFNENLPATSVKGQIELFEKAYKDAGFSYSDVHYVETHGTGTKLGDPNEVIALGELMKGQRIPGFDLRVGSVKTNFGHTEAAAGVAGLFKVILSMQNRILPKNLHFETPNPKIKFDKYSVKVQDTTSAWPTRNGETLKAGVSAFGWGGTNVHLLLEESRLETTHREKEHYSRNNYILPISARSQKSLINYLTAYKDFFNKGEDGEWLLNLCKNAALLRPHFEYRALLTGENKEELKAALNELIASDSIEATKAQPGDKVVFVFPGQGSQWLGMGKTLYQTERVFKKSIDACEKAFKPYVDWSLTSELFATETNSQLQKINVIQPAICAVQIALARLWMSWGIVPDAVAGHSMGEVAAAHIAGILTIDDAARIICTRSKLMSRLSGSGGAMALTELGLEEAKKTVEKYGKDICIAVQNSPKSTVFAGDKPTIERLLTELDQQGIFCRMVKVDVASHSPQMDPIKEELRIALQSIVPKDATYSFFSTVRAEQMTGSEMKADYWVDNLRNTVQFSTVIQHLAETGHAAFVEVSPHPVLVTAINENIANATRDFGVFSSLHREKPEMFEFYGNFQRLYGFGINPKWEDIYSSDVTVPMDLPSYPFLRENYEIEKRLVQNQLDIDDLHPLLGKQLLIAGTENIYLWEKIFSTQSLPLLNGHKVNGKPVFPASAYIEMANAAADFVFGNKFPAIQNLVFHKSLGMEENEAITVQCKVEKLDDNQAVFQIFSIKGNGANSWELHCSGEIKSSGYSGSSAKLEKSYSNEKNVFPNFYQTFKKVGVEYDELFQHTEILQVSQDLIVAKFHLDSQAVKAGKKFQLNPVWIDQLIQPAFATYLKSSEIKTQQTAFVASLANFAQFETIENDQPFLVQIHLHDYVNNSDNHISSFSAEIEAFAAADGRLKIKLEGIKGKIIDLGIPIQETDNSASSADWFNQMLQAEDTERKAIIQAQIIQKVARLIKAQESKINPGMSFKGLGIDSIMAVQLRTILEKEFHVKFAVADLWKYPSLKAFSMFIDVLVYDQLDILKNGSAGQKQDVRKDIFTLSESPNAKMRLVCFHDAGGSSSLFDDWDKLLGPEFEVLCVQLPGRGDRQDEPPYRSFDAFINDYLPNLKEQLGNKPFALFGHSMGGLLAFEVARRLQSQYGMSASTLVVTGTPCLKGFVNTFVNSIIESKLTDEQLARLLPSADKIDLSNDFHRKLIQTLRADFELIHSYKYMEFPELTSNIVAFTADSDDRVRRADVEKWDVETTGSFRLECRKGDHNFVHQDKESVCSVLKEEMVFLLQNNIKVLKTN